MKTPLGWELRPLGRCAKFLSGGTPSKSRSEFWEGDIPWVSSGEMAEVYIKDTPLHITAQAADQGSKLIPSNTVLAVVRGMSLAKEFRVAITKREVAFNQDLKAFACEPDIDSEFLFYALRARRDHIRDLATEASHGTKKLETEVLARFPILVPRPEVQRKIVELISTYDDLIENNRRRMELLEEGARQLYREWFVRLRFPGREHTCISNGVPRGWEVRKVSELVKRIPPGKLYSQDTALTVGKVPILDQGRSGVIGFHDHGPGVDCSTDKPVIVFANHTCYQRIIFYPFSAIQNVLPFVSSNEVPRNLFWLHFVTVRVVKTNAYKGHWPELMAKEVLVPPNKLTDLFGRHVKDNLIMVHLLDVQNQKLRAARDLLLPRLMSGEIAA
jgi:type I restriction enzyme S subunit